MNSNPSRMPVTVFVVARDGNVRWKIEHVLRSTPGLQYVGCCENESAGFAELASAKPDVAVVAAEVQDTSLTDCVSRLHRRAPQTQVLVVLNIESPAILLRLIQAGAKGFLPGDVAASDLVCGVRELHNGGSPMSPRTIRMLVDHVSSGQAAAPSLDKLSEREQQVLALLACGSVYKEIGAQLGISLSTVRAHLHAVYDKLEVRTRAEATTRFHEWNANGMALLPS